MSVVRNQFQSNTYAAILNMIDELTDQFTAPWKGQNDGDWHGRHFDVVDRMIYLLAIHSRM